MLKAVIAAGAALLSVSLSTFPAIDAPRAEIRAVLRRGYALNGLLAGEFRKVTGGESERGLVRLAFNGTRIATSIAGTDGEIIDFTEQKTYRINAGQRVYTERTFGDVARDTVNHYRSVAKIIELSAQLSEGFFPDRTRLDLPGQSVNRARRFQYSVEATETGRRKTVAERDTREFVIIVRAWDGRKTFEDDGGWIATSRAWLADRVPAIDELVAAQRRYAAMASKGAFDGVFSNIELPDFDAAEAAGSFAEFPAVSSKLVAEFSRLDGTILENALTFQIAWNASEFKWRKGNRLITLVELAHEYVAFQFAAPAADLAIPPGFTLKKK